MNKNLSDEKNIASRVPADGLTLTLNCEMCFCISPCLESTLLGVKVITDITLEVGAETQLLAREEHPCRILCTISLSSAEASLRKRHS